MVKPSPSKQVFLPENTHSLPNPTTFLHLGVHPPAPQTIPPRIQAGSTIRSKITKAGLQAPFSTLLILLIYLFFPKMWNFGKNYSRCSAQPFKIDPASSALNPTPDARPAQSPDPTCGLVSGASEAAPGRLQTKPAPHAPHQALPCSSPSAWGLRPKHGCTLGPSLFDNVDMPGPRFSSPPMSAATLAGAVLVRRTQSTSRMGPWPHSCCPLAAPDPAQAGVCVQELSRG